MTDRGMFMREWANGHWYPWSYHGLDLIKRIMAYGLQHGRAYRLQMYPGGPCAEYRSKELVGVEL